MSSRGMIRPTVLSLVLGMTLQNMAFAQQTASQHAEAADPAADDTPAADASPAPDAKALDGIVVVGSRLSSTRVEGPSQVLLIGEDHISATGSVSGDELLQAIPQVGSMMFNNSSVDAGLNAARGDIGSINLRDVGSGNTLLLVNGRRMVPHPGTQTENLVPVQTGNMNSIPLYGVRRVEVLLSGASALYGSDAVAGVMNAVMDTHFQGFQVQAEYGGSEGAELRQGNVNFKAGKWFNDGRTRFTLLGGLTHRSNLPASSRPYSANQARMPLFDGTDFEGITALDPRSSVTAWGGFQTVNGVPVRGANNALITSTGGYFHIDPVGFHGCTAQLTDDACIMTSTQDATIHRPQRFASSNTRDILGEIDRTNLFGTFEQDIGDNFVGFGELAVYRAKYTGRREQMSFLSAATQVVSRNNYYNPFGAMYRADGSLNPYRLPGINAPVEGLDVRLNNYRATDVNNNYVVDDDSFRVLAGVRGMLAGFDWESAALYSAAETADTTNVTNNTRFLEALSWDTPDAYNPFWGGNPDDWTAPLDPGRNQAAIDYFTMPVTRLSKATLFQVDSRFTREDLFSLPGGQAGVAFGAEWRRESLHDDRDENSDGTINYTHPLTGVPTSNVAGMSPAGDTRGSRNVTSLYAEFGLPLVSRDMNVPLVRAMDLQLAGRYERYSDFGGVAKPKVALAWDIVEGLMFRANWSKSFLAPNLMQMYVDGVTVSNNRTDYYVCEAQIRRGDITGVNRCSQSYSTVELRGGNRELEPESSEGWGAGVVLQPKFLPESAGHLTLTADYWEINQTDVIGIVGGGTQLALDYLMRLQGSFNPAVVRLAPDDDRIALFEGTGLDPVGRVDYIEDTFINREPRTLRGIDFGATWRLRTESAGAFYASVNAARMIEISQENAADVQSIIDAQASGFIDDTFNVNNAGNLLGINSKPEWRASFDSSWRKAGWGLGLFVRHISGTDWTSLVSNQGEYFRVPGWTTATLWAEREFGQRGDFLSGTTIRFSVRNVEDRDPPFVPSTAFGYNSAIHDARGRGYYLRVTKRFD